MGLRVLICSQNQMQLSNCVTDLLHNGHNLVMVDSWSAELINPLNLREIDMAIIEADFFGVPAQELLERMQQICEQAELILLAAEEVDYKQFRACTVVTPLEFKLRYAEILSNHGVKLGKHSESFSGVPSLEHPRILFIDDDESARDILKIILTKARYQVEEADSARVGLALLRRFAMEGTPFAAIIIDLMMPGMDGFEFLQQLRMGKWASNTPVIVSSSLNDPTAITRVYQYEISGYVLKPFQPKLLLAQVAAAVESGRRI